MTEPKPGRVLPCGCQEDGATCENAKGRALTDTERSHLSNARMVAALYKEHDRVPEAINDLLGIIARLTAPASVPSEEKTDNDT